MIITSVRQDCKGLPLAERQIIVMKSAENILKLIQSYPRLRNPLPPEYAVIYDQHYKENRSGGTTVAGLSNKIEEWMHKRVAKSARPEGLTTLEIGAGTLNQLKYEPTDSVYDIVEPYTALFSHSPYLYRVRNIYEDISQIIGSKLYDRIISVACFEHICNLPEVIEATQKLIKSSGILSIAIPNEGRFLWKFSYTNTTGREFKKRFNLDYEVMMRHEHINTADEIEMLLRYYYRDVKCSMFGVGKTFSLYRHYVCKNPILH